MISLLSSFARRLIGCRYALGLCCLIKISEVSFSYHLLCVLIRVSLDDVVVVAAAAVVVVLVWFGPATNVPSNKTLYFCLD